jgi:hypothetical protein
MVSVNLKGSKKFKESLPYGSIKMITAAFGYKSASTVGEMLGGKKNENPQVMQCAKDIKDAYDACGFEKKRKSILKTYKNGLIK